MFLLANKMQLRSHKLSYDYKVYVVSFYPFANLCALKWLGTKISQFLDVECCNTKIIKGFNILKNIYFHFCTKTFSDDG
jgi:hypothetical protein